MYIEEFKFACHYLLHLEKNAYAPENLVPSSCAFWMCVCTNVDVDWLYNATAVGLFNCTVNQSNPFREWNLNSRAQLKFQGLLCSVC